MRCAICARYSSDNQRITIHNPDKVRIAQQLLGHASFATTEAYYILAQTLEAADCYQETLLAYVSPEDMNQCAP